MRKLKCKRCGSGWVPRVKDPIKCPRCQYPRKGFKSAKRMLMFIMFLILTSIAHAEVNGTLAVKCIMGEARGESYEGKVAIASALRNRGTTKGVYGCKAKFTEPAYVWKEAKKAWLESAIKDLTNGATFWENVEDFGEPYWASSMQITAKVGSHTFYRKDKK